MRQESARLGRLVNDLLTVSARMQLIRDDNIEATTYEIVADGAKRMSINEFYRHTYGGSTDDSRIPRSGIN